MSARDSCFTAHEVEMDCGHTVKVSLYGTEQEQRAELKRLRGAFCRDCWLIRKNQRDTMHAGEVEAEHPGLPTLIGSEKQVAWARVIRAQAIPVIEEVVGNAIADLAATAQEQPDRAQNCEFFAELNIRSGAWAVNQAEAKFWIQQRERFESVEAAQRWLTRRVYAEIGKDAAAQFRAAKGGAQ